MQYLNSHSGGLQNEAVRIPDTFDHVTQFLYHCKDEHWGHLQNIAGQALDGQIQFEDKIKPSSFQMIRDKRAVELMMPLIDEHIGHNDPTSEVHRGGGIWHAIKSVLQVAGGMFGGKKVNEWIGPNAKHKNLSQKQINMAKLVQGVYKGKRPEEIGNWVRIDDLDSRYGSFWKNQAGEYTLAVRGTKLNLRDIWADIKIAAGSHSQRDDDLVKSLREFNKMHPGAKLNVAGHSLGTMLATNALKEVDLPGQKEVFLYNPASSPFQSKQAVRDIQENPNWKVKYHLNRNDIVSNYFGQQLSQEERDRHVFYGKFSRSPLNSHFLAQWVESY
jgi:hypothetical protein